MDFEQVLGDSAKINSQLKLLWIGCGTEDTLFQRNREFSQQLSMHKVEHIFALRVEAYFRG